MRRVHSTVLVYIPCHIDLVDALNQVSILRDDFRTYSRDAKSSFDTLKVIISINSYIPSSEELALAEELCDEVINYGHSLLADVNISQGFLCALRINPEIFWLLSTNDKLLPDSLSRILRTFESDREIDLVVGNSKFESKKYRELNIENINGLISGVIYNTKNLKQFFNVASFFPWTGWSHLAVIESAMNGNRGLVVYPIPQELLYTQTNRPMGLNGIIYAHSFTGDMIQKFLFRANKSQRKKSLRIFVRKNFYRAHLYSVRDSNKHEMNVMVNPNHYLSWNSLIAEALLRANTPISYVVYIISKNLPFELLLKSSIFRRIQRLL